MFICFSPVAFSASTLHSSGLCRNYLVTTPTGFPRAFEDVVRSQIGVRERGCNNCGADVNKYQDAAKIPRGDSARRKDGPPYCCAFFVWDAFEAIKKIGAAVLDCPFIRTGLASLQRLHLQQIGIEVRSVAAPFLVFWQYPNSSSGHVADVFEEHAGGWVKAVSPNSGGGGSARDGSGGGSGVNVKYYNLSHPLAGMFLRAKVKFI